MGGFEPFAKREIPAAFKSRRLRSPIADHRRRIRENVTFKNESYFARAKLYAVSDNKLCLDDICNDGQVLSDRREVYDIGISSLLKRALISAVQINPLLSLYSSQLIHESTRET